MQALGQSFQSASPIRFPARRESYLAETKRNWNIRLDKFATLARLLCTTGQRRPAFLAKLLCGYRNYWFCENGDRLGTSLGKARPSRDVQLLSKTGEAGKSCAGVMQMKKSLRGGLFDIGSITSCFKNGKPA